MPKLKIDDLKNIVMEGGGARGAAYLGAIRALEKKMSERSDVQAYSDLGKRKAGLLDYSNTTDNTLAIKGIAGSSAGAVTTFALALGFNSDEIDQILKYPFKNFLKDTDAGKYRMIDKDGKLAIGEDKANPETGTKEMGRSATIFKFDFNNNATQIGDNVVKRGKRDLLFGAFFKIITDGVTSNLQQLTNLTSRLLKNNSPEDAPPFWRGLFRWALRPNNNMLTKIGVARFLRLLFFKLIIPKVFDSPIKADTNTVMAIFADRGMFSGFAVREFFMDLVLYAATRNTRFHREFVKIVEDKSLEDLTKSFGKDVKGDFLSAKINTKDIGSSLLKYENNFSLKEGRAASKIGRDKDLEFILHILSNLTFKQFNKITKVDFAVCVSNFTTDFPVYFSHTYTPDFRVMEAVAASMSIPPAIKPLYNESDVVAPINKTNRVDVQTDKGTIPFVNTQGEFDIADYHLYEHIVKVAIAQIMGKEGIRININNTIDISAFLEPLRNLVIGKNDADTQAPLINKDLPITLNQPVNGVIYIVDHTLLQFFYNAAYKGMFFDGGYRNNIPYNYFRTSEGKLPGVLAIKLDAHFPPDLLTEVSGKIRELIPLQNALRDSFLDGDDDITQHILGLINEKRMEVENQVAIIFDKYLEKWVLGAVSETDREERKKHRRQMQKNNKAIRKLTDAAISHYLKNRLSAPWKYTKSIINIAFEGYAYGSEKGQVKHISDHNHIIALYDYGIGTYDFELNEVLPQVGLAQAKAEEATLNFFNT